MVEKVMAMLGSSTRRVVEDLHADGRIQTMDDAKTGRLTSGSRFIVVTREHQLQGKELIAYEVFGQVGQRLIDVAEANVR